MNSPTGIFLQQYPSIFLQQYPIRFHHILRILQDFKICMQTASYDKKNPRISLNSLR